jgi:glycosyltransferase involved in cell wall biosynthesis
LKKILLISNYAWTIHNFRRDLIKNIDENNYEIHVLTQYDKFVDKLKPIVKSTRHLIICKNKLNIFYEITTIINILYVALIIKPNLIISYTLKPVIYSNIVSKILRINNLSTITGFGTMFLGSNIKLILAQLLYKAAINKNTVLICQNKSDLSHLKKVLYYNNNKNILIKGSGVNTKHFKYKCKPYRKVVTFLFVGRLLIDKGVMELCNAARLIKQKYKLVNFIICGAHDPSNPRSIKLEYITQQTKIGSIDYIDFKKNIFHEITKCDCAILPSYREGLSKYLLEACSVGRPIITTNVPGCKDIIKDNYNGYLCEAKSVGSLVNAIEKFLNLNHTERLKMGELNRVIAVKHYSTNIINQKYIDIIDKIT